MIPMEWVEKIFFYLENFYGQKWKDMQGTCKDDQWKGIWRTALKGLTKDCIKNALRFYRIESKKDYRFPPYPLEFYRTADYFNCSTWNHPNDAI